jgi:GTP-binding protein
MVLSRKRKHSMLIDDVIIRVKAGNGGDGSVSFKRNAQTAKGGPDGGNGGNGGSIFVRGSTNVSDLKDFKFKKKIQAEDGISGKKNKLFGRNGEDLTVLLPLGTTIIDQDSGEHIDIIDEKKTICLAQGGKGGKGNTEFKSATEQTPRFAEKGEIGEEKHLKLVLKHIADVGLVGLPNSGKSTLLSLLTHAKPKIGNYPFTTLEPYLGTADTLVLADIPGIIEGASKGKGLGLQFLKHIEKTKVLLYCIDSSEQNPSAVYTLIQNEFQVYNPELLEKPEIILLTKMDLVSHDELEEKKKAFVGKQVISVSEYDPTSIAELFSLLQKILH